MPFKETGRYTSKSRKKGQPSNRGYAFGPNEKQSGHETKYIEQQRQIAMNAPGGEQKYKELLEQGRTPEQAIEIIIHTVVKQVKRNPETKAAYEKAINDKKNPKTPHEALLIAVRLLEKPE